MRATPAAAPVPARAVPARSGRGQARRGGAEPGSGRGSGSGPGPVAAARAAVSARHAMSALNWKPFVYGGLASIVAEFGEAQGRGGTGTGGAGNVPAGAEAGVPAIPAGTFPVDLTKTRLQVQGQSTDARFREVRYRGMFHALFRICREEGGRALYSG